MSDVLESYEGPRGDTALVRFLYPAPAERKTSSIFKWWEKRRFAYNAIVGASGLTTLTLNTLIRGADGSWLPVILFFGIAANVAYTLGPFAESVMNKLWGDRVLPVGPALFRQGVLFSVGLVLVLPTIILTIGSIIRIIGGFF